MYKRLTTVIIFSLFLFTAQILPAQDDKLDSLDFSIEGSPMKEQKPPYFAVAGGYLGTFLYVNFSDLNKHLLDNNFGLGELKAPLFLSGAEGFAAIVLIPNVRVGFFGMAGSKLLENNIMVAGQSVKRSLDYSVALNGLAIDYAFTPFKSFAIIPGVNLGWGSLSIDNYQTQDNFNWNNFNTNGSDTVNYYKSAKTVFSYVQPNLNIEYALTPFTVIRASVGYAYSFSLFSKDWEWYYDKNAKIPSGSSLDKVKASGMTLQIGLFVGLFNY